MDTAAVAPSLHSGPELGTPPVALQGSEQDQSCDSGKLWSPRVLVLLMMGLRLKLQFRPG